MGRRFFDRNSHKRDRVAVERGAVAGLRTELISQGVLQPLPADVLAAGGRSLDMAMPRATVLAAALRQLHELRAENARLAQCLERRVTPRYLTMGPPGGSTVVDMRGGLGAEQLPLASSAINFDSWAFQYSSVPTVLWVSSEDVSCRIVSCNRAFGALLGLVDSPHYALDCTNPRFPNGAALTWNSISGPDFHLTPEITVCSHLKIHKYCIPTR
jgi:hypothetical protein